MPLNIPSSPDPFPLGLHALPLGLLDHVCTQAGPQEEHIGTAYTHTRLINESSAALINFPIPAVSSMGQLVGLSTGT